MKAWESNIRKVEPYVPGEQPKVQDVIKLNTNENPYGPSENVRKAMEAIDIDRCRLYPDPDVTKLVKSIADYYGMDNNQVFVGVGSDDVLSMCFLTFFNGKKPVLFPDITYSFYSVWADLYRIPYEKQKLDDNMKIVPEDYYKENGGVIFTKSLADTPPKSIYASSTITTTSLLCSIISLTLSRSIKRPVGALGLGKITPPFSL